MNKSDWWFKFDFAAWRTDPSLGKCSMATQGVWINMLCSMRESATYFVSGTIEQLSRLVGCFPDEMRAAIDELESTKTADVTRTPVTEMSQHVTLGHEIVTLVSRRFHRELSTREHNRLRKQKERGHADVTPPSHDRVRVRVKSKSKTLSTDSLSIDTPSIVLSPADAVEPQKKGTRIPTKFVVTKPMQDWVAKEIPSVDWKSETEKFVDYYRSVSGQKGVRLDWQATWRNWMRNAVRDYSGKTGNGLAKRRPTNADKLKDIADMLQENYG